MDTSSLFNCNNKSEIEVEVEVEVEGVELIGWWLGPATAFEFIEKEIEVLLREGVLKRELSS